jgi:replicative DNA helicase
VADWESKLIGKAVQSGSIEKLISHGVESRHFVNPTHREVFDYLQEHAQTYRTAPSPETVRENFPEYTFEVVTDPLEYVQQEFITEVKRREFTEVTRELISIIDENDRKQLAVADEILLDKAKRLSSIVPVTNVSRFSEMNGRISAYKERKEMGISPGIPYNIPMLDDVTQGLHPHQYVTISGFTGVGKSTLGLFLCLQHYLAGYTPMIISLEMDEEEVYRLLDSLAAELRRQAIKAMTLSGADVERWEEYADRCEKVDSDIIVIDVDHATPEKVYAETARWSPDVVLVDYVQLMVGPKDLRSNWEKVDYCSKSLKLQARGMKIPVYGLAQTNAEGADQGGKLTTLGGSKAIGFHSDLVLGLKQDDEDRAMKKMNVVIDKNRGGPRGEFALYWDLGESKIMPWRGTHAYPERV